MAYENIKSHIKPGFHSLSKKHIFGKTAVGIQIDPPSSFRVKSKKLADVSEILKTVQRDVT